MSPVALVTSSRGSEAKLPEARKTANNAQADKSHLRRAEVSSKYELFVFLSIIAMLALVLDKASRLPIRPNRIPAAPGPLQLRRR